MQIRLKKSELRRLIKEEKELARLTGTRLTVGNFVRALQARGYIFEETGIDDRSDEQDELYSSLDNQVDRFLAKYEEKSRPVMSENFAREWMFNEADEDEGEEPPPDEENAEEDESSPDDDMFSEPAAPSTKKLTLSDINVEKFANEVARLIMHYDKLLEIEQTIITRSVNFLAQNYDDDVIDQFRDAMLEQHGMDGKRTKREIELDKTQPPRADRAGPGGV